MNTHKKKRRRSPAKRKVAVVNGHRPRRTIGRHKKRRPSRINGTGVIMNSAMEFLAGQIGFFAGQMLNKVIPDDTNKYLVGGGKLAVGFLPQIAMKNNGLAKAFGIGLGASGTFDIATEAGIINGIYGLNDDDELAVAIEGDGGIEVEFEELNEDGTPKMISENIMAENIMAGDLAVVQGDLAVVQGSDGRQTFIY